MSLQANSCATWVPTKRESQPPSPLFHSLGTTRHATARTSTRSHRRDESFNGDRNAVSESRWSRRLPYGHASSSSNTGSMPPKKLGVLARRSRDFVDSVAALGMTTLVAGRMRETQRFIVVDSKCGQRRVRILLGRKFLYLTALPERPWFFSPRRCLSRVVAGSRLVWFCVHNLACIARALITFSYAIFGALVYDGS